MKTLFWTVVLLSASALFSSASAAPQAIDYQGFLRDIQSGEPLQGSHDLVFRLYETMAGPDSSLWSEAHPQTDLDQGVFSTQLGGTNPLTPELFAHPTLFLEVEVDGQVLSPRTQVVSVPYALRAQVSAQADSADFAAHAAYADSAAMPIQELAPPVRIEGPDPYPRYGLEVIGEGHGGVTFVGSTGGASQNMCSYRFGSFSPQDGLRQYWGLTQDPDANGSLDLGLESFVGQGGSGRVMQISHTSGTVGLGTSTPNPAARLDVNGLTLGSTYSTYGQDLGNGSCAGNLGFNNLTFSGTYGYAVGDEYIQFESSYNPQWGEGKLLAKITGYRAPEDYDLGYGKMKFTVRNQAGSVDPLVLDPGGASVNGNLSVFGNSRIATKPLGGGAIDARFLGYPNRGALVFQSDRTGYTFTLANERTSDGDILPIITMYDDGRVGVGTTTPAYTLDVGGDIRSTGTIHGNFEGTIDNALHWTGHSWGDAYPLASNADEVDGLHGTQFLRNDASGSLAGDLTISAGNASRALYASTESSTAEAGVKGAAWAPSGNTTGVLGVVPSPGIQYAEGNPAAVYGWASGTGNGDAFGVLGRCWHSIAPGTQGWDAPAGVFGWADVGAGLCWGVWGENRSATGSTSGVRGLSLDTSHTVYGVEGETRSPNGLGVHAIGGMGVRGVVALEVETAKGPSYMYGMASTENWFEDFGSGRLQGGRAEVALEAEFTATLDLATADDYKVFLTPTSEDVKGTLIAVKGTSGFAVIESGNPTGSGSFDYRIVGRRKGYAGRRLESVEADRPDLSLSRPGPLNQGHAADAEQDARILRTGR